MRRYTVSLYDNAESLVGRSDVVPTGVSETRVERRPSRCCPNDITKSNPFFTATTVTCRPNYQRRVRAPRGRMTLRRTRAAAGDTATVVWPLHLITHRQLPTVGCLRSMWPSVTVLWIPLCSPFTTDLSNARRSIMRFHVRRFSRPKGHVGTGTGGTDVGLTFFSDGSCRNNPRRVAWIEQVSNRRMIVNGWTRLNATM